MKRRRRSGGEMEKIGKDEGEKNGLEIGKDEGERSGLKIGEEWVGEKQGK